MNRLFHKLLAVTCTAAAAVSLAGCSKELKGKTYDTGRISVFVPEGWTIAEDYTEDKTVMLIKSDDQKDVMYVPSISVTYMVPTDNGISGKEMYDNVEDIPEFDAGDYHWTGYKFTTDLGDCTTIETEGDYGLASVGIWTRMTAGTDDAVISFNDKDVQAVIKSLKFTKFMTADWFSIDESGALRLTLEEKDGYEWYGDYNLCSDDLDVSIDGTTITAEGSGIALINYALFSEDEKTIYGKASVGIHAEDGKIVGVDQAEKEIYDSPKENENYVEPEEIDFEALAAVFVHNWLDPDNNMNLSIVENDDGSFKLTFTKDSDTWVMEEASFSDEGHLVYSEYSYNGADAVETVGDLSLLGENVLFWYDEELDEISGTMFGMEE